MSDVKDAKQPEEAAVPGKRPYRAPELAEWGSLAELTWGDLAGFADFPIDGGSESV